MDESIYKRLHDIIRKVYNEAHTENDAYRIIDLLDSVSDNQVKSKQWLVDTLTMYKPSFDQIIYLAGWYGLGPYLLSPYANKVHSVDYDPKAKKYGKILFNNVKFVQSDMFKRPLEVYDAVVLTSCEHVPKSKLTNFILDIPKDTLICFQSTDYEHPSHINRHETHQDLADQFPSYRTILFSDSLQLDNCKRHMVIAR